MPNEMRAALEQLWPNLLLTLGWVLIIASGVAIALCVLGGCLDAIDRRRAERDQRHRVARSRQPVAVLDTTGSQPALRTALAKGVQVSADGIDPAVYVDAAQISEWAGIQQVLGMD